MVEIAMLTIEGTVSRIIYRNDETKYTVASVEAEDEELVVTGKFFDIQVGIKYSFKGDLTFHKQYGEQFEVKELKIVKEQNLKGIKMFLGSGNIRGIGPVLAEVIVNYFGSETLFVMEKEPHRLKEVPGIGEKKFQALQEALEEHRKLLEVSMELGNFGVKPHIINKLYNNFSQDCVEILKDNPYILCNEPYFMSFNSADEVAMNMNIPRDFDGRIEGAIEYIMRDISNWGHCYLNIEELKEKASNILQVSEEKIEEGLLGLTLRGKIYQELFGEEVYVYPQTYYEAENNVASMIKELNEATLKEFMIDHEELIKDTERALDITFSNTQKKAISKVLDKGVLVITGGPGTGKTTILNGILTLAQGANLSVVVAAPTGRAANRINMSTGHDASTIHRLLEYKHETGLDYSFFEKNSENPIDADIIIIDESSMIDINLMEHLLKAVKVGSRLVLLGDVDQLPAVGPGNVLKDIIESSRINVVKLDKIFRQAEESLIVVNAHSINQGIALTLNRKEGDFFFLNKFNDDEIVKTIIELCNGRLESYYNVEDKIFDIQVITPSRKGSIGVNNLNTELQNVLNPKDSNKLELSLGHRTFRIGDKVMQIKNNYDLKWKNDNFEEGEGVFNGDMGKVVSVDKSYGILGVEFPMGKRVEYDFRDLEQLELAYAVTVHKSQGSEFPIVIMPISYQPPLLANRNLLYTAVTRGAKLVVLVGEKRWLQYMIDNSSIRARNTRLSYRINNLYELELD